MTDFTTPQGQELGTESSCDIIGEASIAPLRESLIVRKNRMSLHPKSIEPVPEQTAQVARAAFPKGNPYLTLRDELGAIFHDDDFTDLYPVKGQPGLSPWRLALITIM